MGALCGDSFLLSTPGPVGLAPPVVRVCRRLSRSCRRDDNLSKSEKHLILSDLSLLCFPALSVFFFWS